MESWLNRTEALIGKDNLEKLRRAHVIVFGCGGVGSYAIEALARSGIGCITIVDKDVVDVSNINRQLIADTTTIGKPKVEVEKSRLLDINPELKITTHQLFYDASKVDIFFNISSTTNLNIPNYDYVIDAIDCVNSKISLVQEAHARNIPIISCMGTGNKLDPTMFEVADISKTSMCPLAKVMRKELKKRQIEHLKVVYSKEEPSKLKNGTSTKNTPASISFVPSVAGLILAGEVIRDIINFS